MVQVFHFTLENKSHKTTRSTERFVDIFLSLTHMYTSNHMQVE